MIISTYSGNRIAYPYGKKMKSNTYLTLYIKFHSTWIKDLGGKVKIKDEIQSST